ncbi:MAG: lysophospholipase [Mailhella sp.]|nr:lysophospholipase [Mailhella sp.]
MAEIYEQGTIRTNDGLNIFFRRDIPRHPKGIVVLLHTLAEHSGRYDHAAAELNSAGYGVYRFDCRGHGRSDGPRGDVRDFFDYIFDTDMIVEHAHNACPGLPVFLLGHSMGGFVAAAYAAEHPEKIAGEIITGAAIRMVPALSFLLSETSSRHRERGDERFSLVAPCWKENDEGSWNDDRYVLDSVTVRLAGNVWLSGADWFQPRMKDVVTPLLILHGEDDWFVPPEASRWFYERVSSPDRLLHIYPKRGHFLLDADTEVLSDITAWLDEHRNGTGNPHGSVV